jgi:hypothetical protein
MSTNVKDSKNGKAAAVTKLIAGGRKHFPNGSLEIPIGGRTMTIDAAINELQTFLNYRAEVVAAQATAKTKVATENTESVTLDAFISAFTAFVKVAFRGKADALADFGLKPPKARTPLTAEQKAVVAAKALATREARGTKGPKAKTEVHGNITAKLVVTPAPATTPEAPAASPASPPAAVAPTGGTTTPQHS